MAEWWESSSNIRGVAKVMADEFKKAKVGCCDQDGGGGGSSSGGETPQDKFNDAQNEATERLGMFGTIISSLVSPLKKVRDAIDAAFGDVIRRAAYDFETAMAAGTEANKTWRMQMYAMELGDTAANIADLSVASRQSMLAMGGMETWIGRINVAQDEYFGYLGDTAKTTRYLAKQMQMFGEFGLKPSMETMHDMSKIVGGTSKSLKDVTTDLYKMGIPVEEQQEMLRSLLEDENVQMKLRAVNSEKERTAIVRNLMARQQEFRALGMTKDQALAAGKALAAMAGKKPMDRYKQAAKATAALSAMGIEGAAEVGNIIRLGLRATKKQLDWAAERLGAAKDLHHESKILGTGFEFTISKLWETGGLADLMGEGGLFSTKIRETIKVQEELIKSYKTLGGKTTGEAVVITEAMQTIQEVNNTLTKTIPGMMLGKGVIGVGALALMEGAFKAMGDKGLLGEKQQKGIAASFEKAKGLASSPEKQKAALTAIYDELVGMKNAAAKNLGIDMSGLMDNPVFNAFGDIGTNVSSWYKEWRDDKFGNPEEQKAEKQAEEAQNTLNAIVQEMRALTQVMTNADASSKEYYLAQMANARDRRQVAEDQLEEAKAFNKNAKTKTTVKGNQVGAVQ